MPELTPNCTVTFESRQIMQGEEEKSVISVPAYRTNKNGIEYIYYTVYYDSENECENREIVKIKNENCIELIRNGFLKSKMTFIQNETTVTDYQSPAGHLYISITTENLKTVITDDKITINMKYKINLDDDVEVLIYFKFTADSNIDEKEVI